MHADCRALNPAGSPDRIHKDLTSYLARKCPHIVYYFHAYAEHQRTLHFGTWTTSLATMASEHGSLGNNLA